MTEIENAYDEMPYDLETSIEQAKNQVADNIEETLLNELIYFQDPQQASFCREHNLPDDDPTALEIALTAGRAKNHQFFEMREDLKCNVRAAIEVYFNQVRKGLHLMATDK